jgi:hypothetical protein
MSAFEADRFNHSRTSPRGEIVVINILTGKHSLSPARTLDERTDGLPGMFALLLYLLIKDGIAANTRKRSSMFGY